MGAGYRGAIVFILVYRVLIESWRMGIGVKIKVRMGEILYLKGVNVEQSKEGRGSG